MKPIQSVRPLVRRAAAICAVATGIAAIGVWAIAADGPADPPSVAVNQWHKLDGATLHRFDAPLVFEPQLKRFLVLGGSIPWDDYPKPHPFDELALDVSGGRWENWIPEGKDWGPRFGDCKPPAWKSENWGLVDAAGNCRPNLSVYRGLFLYDQYALDPDSGRVYFYMRGSTFSYDPAARSWKDLKPATHPARSGGTLLWSSMCYAANLKKVLLFGGGNVQTGRGDPGTWTYDPATNVWEELKLERQPPQRTLAPLVYDPVNQKVILFGGDQLNQLLSDTWTFDGQKWEEKKPDLAPAPRGGHALVWLPGAKKVLLLGGYGYESAEGYYPAVYRGRPLEGWTYDVAANRWDFIRSWAKDCPPAGRPDFGRMHMLRAAADADDQVAVVSDGTWLCRLDVSRPHAATAEKLGAKLGAVERRQQWCDPAWYKQAQAGIPEKTKAELDTLPSNTWVLRNPPRRPGFNVDWGSAVYSPDRDVIMRFSGGHCAYSGTAPQIYDVKTNHWSLPFAPEMPLDFCSSNEQVPGEWSFTSSPWMSGHTYKTTGYEPTSKTMIYASHAYSYFFDPAEGRWSRAEKPSPFHSNMYVTTVCTTPKGVVGWAESSPPETDLYLLDAKTRTWTKMPLKMKLPQVNADEHGMAYDSKRDRLLLFSGADPKRGDVMAYDLKTGDAQWLGAAGKAKAAVRSRETIYLPELDAVLVGHTAAGAGGKRLWLLYDCTDNCWRGADLHGPSPLTKEGSMVSLGLMYDPGRKLVWAVDQTNQVFVLRLNSPVATLPKFTD